MVGVNAYYSFLPDDSQEISTTNWQTRLDTVGPHNVGQWLNSVLAGTAQPSSLIPPNSTSFTFGTPGWINLSGPDDKESLTVTVNQTGFSWLLRTAVLATAAANIDLQLATTPRPSTVIADSSSPGPFDRSVHVSTSTSENGVGSQLSLPLAPGSYTLQARAPTASGPIPVELQMSPSPTGTTVKKTPPAIGGPATAQTLHDMNSNDLYKISITTTTSLHFDVGVANGFGLNLYSDLSQPPLNASSSHGGDATLDYSFQPGTYWLSVSFTSLTDTTDLSYSLSINQSD